MKNYNRYIFNTVFPGLIVFFGSCVISAYSELNIDVAIATVLAVGLGFICSVLYTGFEQIVIALQSRNDK